MKADLKQAIVNAVLAQYPGKLEADDVAVYTKGTRGEAVVLVPKATYGVHYTSCEGGQQIGLRLLHSGYWAAGGHYVDIAVGFDPA